MKQDLRILHLEDDPKDAELIREKLEEEGFLCIVELVKTQEDYLRALKERCFDLVLADYTVPAFDGLSALATAREISPDLPFIFCSGTIGENQAIESLKSGATDYVLKDNLVRLAQAVRRALKDAEESVERRRAEKALRESEERYRSLVELSPLLFIIHQHKKIVYLNPEALKSLGASKPEEIIGRSLLDIVHPYYWDVVNERVRLMEQGMSVPSLEERFIRLDKKIIDVEVTNVRILYQEQPMVLVIGRDITEQKEAEKERVALQEKLQQAQKMEAIGTLAGGIAHDFNNILAAIIGYGELAGLDIGENTKAKYNLQQSMKSALRAKNLVHQILTFSRQGVQERKVLDIKPIVKEGLKFLRSSLPATVEIRQDVEKDLGAIEADPTQVYQVLMNLCTNAAQAMEGEGGILEVSLGNVDVDGGISAALAGIGPGPYIRLRVGDTGHGIPAENIERIFDPYFTTKEVGKGTGLGLAVVHGIVESWRGGIAVSSEVGKGSVFDVYFPRIEAAELPSASDKSEPLPLGKHERVLFVDDEEQIAEIGKEILKYLGYEAEVRTSSVEALALFRAKLDHFDLVITDMTMPNMTGDKLAQEMIRIRPGIPIILSTGFSERITEEKTKAMGIREFVMKPLVIRDLAQAMRRALNSEKKKG